MNIEMSRADYSKGLLEQYSDCGQVYDYVLVFTNPFDVPKYNYSCALFQDEITAEKAFALFDKCFRVKDSEPLYQRHLAQLTDALGGSPTIKCVEVIKLVVEACLSILQEYLMLDLNAHISRDADEIFIQLSASEENLKVQADLIDYRLQLKGDAEDNEDYQEVPPYGPYEKRGDKNVKCMFGASRDHEEFYKKYDRDGNEVPEGSLFKGIDRIRLLYSMILSVIDIGKLISSGLLVNSFPLPSKNTQKTIAEEWPSFRNVFKRQDIGRIRNYFGEKIAIYFAWLEFYTWYLVLPGVIGAAISLIVYFSKDVEDQGPDVTTGEASILIFALMMSLGSTLFDQLWARRQCKLAWQWGMTGLSILEEQRPEYKGEYLKDKISGKMKKIAETTKWIRIKKILGYWVILMFVVLVVILLIALFIYRSYQPPGWRRIMVGSITAIQIKVLNYVYKHVARMLTNWENLETNNEYNTSLTIKLFLFQFTNSYASLFYIAFAKYHFEGCANDSCIQDLATQLGGIFVTNFVLNFLELGLPYALGKWRVHQETKKLREMGLTSALSPEERESKLSTYEAPLEDYMEVVISYGYVVLFGVAFPFTPLLALMLGVIELRVDAWKLSNLTARPFPEQAENIGVWITITQILAILGCATNAGIVIFTTNVFDAAGLTERWVLFLVIEHLLVLSKILISLYIPDVPFKVQKGLEWSNRVMNEKLFNRLTDNDLERTQRHLEFVASEDRRIFSREDMLSS